MIMLIVELIREIIMELLSKNSFRSLINQSGARFCKKITYYYGPEMLDLMTMFLSSGPSWNWLCEELEEEKF